MFSNFWILPLLLVLAVPVTAQTTPTSYPYDCRRSNTGCKNNGACIPANKKCKCTPGFEGFDCGLNSSTVIKCNVNNACHYKANCTTGGGCFCSSGTYGKQCSNPRVNVWCTQTEMFINIYPHGDNSFKGNVFVSRPGIDHQALPSACKFDKVTGLDLTKYPYVKNIHRATPSLLGYYKVLPFAKPAGGAAFCAEAKMINNTSSGSTDYVHEVVLKYRQDIISNLDQLISFRCSITQTNNVSSVPSVNAMSVSVLNNNYQRMNVTDKVEPVKFELRDPRNNAVITNNLKLGDPLDLFFTMQTSANSTLAGFKVTQCTATNGQSPKGNKTAPSIKFLDKDCPTTEASLLFRDNVVQKEENGQSQAIIPLSAFRFVGDSDEVTFTCILKICTKAKVTADPKACLKDKCPGETVAANTTQSPNTGGKASTGNKGGRRKRSTSENEKEVHKTVTVTSGFGKTPRVEQGGETPTSEQDDCMTLSHVHAITAIFVVVLIILLIIVVCLTVRLLKSRMKVVDAPDMISRDLSVRRYSLPRLSLSVSHVT